MPTILGYFLGLLSVIYFLILVFKSVPDSIFRPTPHSDSSLCYLLIFKYSDGNKVLSHYDKTKITLIRYDLKIKKKFTTTKILKT